MKKGLIAVSCVAFAAFIALLTVSIVELTSSNSSNLSAQRSNSSANSSSSQSTNYTSTVANTSSATETYTIKAYNGHIAVFQNDATEPFRELNVAISSLPQADQTLLENGIVVHSLTDVNSVLEDYNS